jgi:peptidoglycan hydrolase-like protein with peptidoglycan-binding domain
MIVPLPRELHEGDRGQDVLMVKRAISRAGYRRWGLGLHKHFGALLTKNVKQLQRDCNLKADGVYGAATHKKLAAYFDAYGANEMVKLWKAAQETPVDVAVKANLIAHNFAWQNAYTQTASRMMIVRLGIKTLAALTAFFKKKHVLHEDCSSFQTGAAMIGGCVNPNTGGRTYTEAGYTGTMAVHGVRLTRPRKGALGFFGAGFPYRHVVRALEDGDRPLCGSHGRPGFDLEYPDYRSDFSHWRFYD